MVAALIKLLLQSRSMENFLLVSPTFADFALPNFEIKKFPDGENYVRIPGVEELGGKRVVILHRLFPNQDPRLFQLFQLISVLKPVAKEMVAVVPYLPYARQDDIVRDGEAYSAQMLCKMMADAGLAKLITFDCHFAKGPGEMEFGGLRIENRTMAPALLAHLKPMAKDPLFVTLGERTKYMLGGKDGPHITKVHGGFVETETLFRRTTTPELGFDVAGRNVVIVEDVIAGGSTMAGAAQACRARGAKSVISAAVHGVLAGNAFDRIRAAGAKQVVVTDTVPGPAAVVSIASELKDLLL